jgi:hypothetical protein
MHMARVLRLIGVPALAAGLLVGLGATGSGMASTTAGSAMAPTTAGLAHLEIVKVPLSSLSPSVRAHLAKDRLVVSQQQDYAEEVVSVVDNFQYCLDANAAGPTAGENGDKVQLWTCNNGANQFWYFGSQNSAGNGYITNDYYSSKCLNADDSGGLADGKHVQLWGCADTSNMLWDLGGWSNCLTITEACPIYLSSDNYKWVLDAVSQDIGNGDQIQIWTPDNGDNQFWVNSP